MSVPRVGFTKLSEEVVHRGAIISVAVGTYQDPNGQIFTRDVVRHPGAVAVVALDDDGKVTLVRQYRAAVDDWLLEIPAGKRDLAGEDPLETAKRELIEEVGLEAAQWELLASFHFSPGFCDELGFVYLAQDLTAVAENRQGIEEETMTIEQVPLRDVLALITSGVIHDAKTCIGLLLARERFHGHA